MNPIAETETRFMAPRSAERISHGSSDSLGVASLTTEIEVQPVTLPDEKEPAAGESLFDRFGWLYSFFRERIFRDDTDRIVRSLWSGGEPEPGTRLMELGCGPGFYSCGLAAQFPQISVLGVDCSTRQLDYARRKARKLRLSNCRFASDDVLDLSLAVNSFNAVIAARLFTVLPDPERALDEVYRVLRPGGQCVIAEPRYAFWASLPLYAMWLIAGLTRMNNGYREPTKARVLSSSAFRRLFEGQPWSGVRTWQDGRYQYALCEKA